ncbi:MAG: hypothetical protein ACI4IE_07920 [Eubacterium sp.]
MNNQNNYNYQQNPYQQPFQQNNYPNYQPPKPPKKNITAIVLGVCLGVIAIALIIAIIVVSGLKSSGDVDNAKTEDYSQEYSDSAYADNQDEEYSDSSNITTTTEKVNSLTPLEEKLDNSIWYLYYRHNNDTFEFDTEEKTVKYISNAPKYGEEEYSATYECVDENTIKFTIEAYNETYIITDCYDASKVFVEIVLEDGSNQDGHAGFLSNDEDEAIELFSEYYNSENY